MFIKRSTISCLVAALSFSMLASPAFADKKKKKPKVEKVEEVALVEPSTILIAYQKADMFVVKTVQELEMEKITLKTLSRSAALWAEFHLNYKVSGANIQDQNFGKQKQKMAALVKKCEGVIAKLRASKIETAILIYPDGTQGLIDVPMINAISDSYRDLGRLFTVVVQAKTGHFQGDKAAFSKKFDEIQGALKTSRRQVNARGAQLTKSLDGKTVLRFDFLEI